MSTEKLTIADEDFDSMYQLITSISPSDIELIDIDYEQFEYLGFDARLFMRVLADRAKKANRTEDEFKNDVISMVAVCLLRGNLSKTGLTKMSKEGRKLIADLVKIYKIIMRMNNKTRNTSLNRDDVTFPRAVATFPWIASSLIKKDEIFRCKVDLSKLGSHSLPEPMKHTGFSSLIPVCSAGSIYLIAHVIFMLDLSFTINPLANFNIEEAWTKQLNICKAAYNGSLLSSENRAKMFVDLGLASKESFSKCIDLVIKSAPAEYKELDKVALLKKYIKRDLVDFTVLG